MNQLDKILDQRNFEPNEKELKEHKDFIKEINNSIWNKYI